MIITRLACYFGRRGMVRTKFLCLMTPRVREQIVYTFTYSWNLPVILLFKTENVGRLDWSVSSVHTSLIRRPYTNYAARTQSQTPSIHNFQLPTKDSRSFIARTPFSFCNSRPTCMLQPWLNLG